MGENIGSKIKSPGRRAMRAMMKAREVIIAPIYIDSPERAESARIWGNFKAHTHRPHKDGNRTTRRAALKAKRTAQRQASRKRQAVGAAVDVFRVGSAEAVAEIRRLIRTFGATR